MSNYTKSTNFATKDSLPSGSAAKIVKGTEIDTEFNNLAIAIATKADQTAVDLKAAQTDVDLKAPKASPTFTGSPVAPNNALNTRGTAVATMESFNTEFDKSLAASGYQKLPGGLIVQWGVATVSTSGTLVSLPIVFPNTGRTLTAMHNGSTPAVTCSGILTSASQITLYASTNGVSVFWIALGY